MKPHAFIAMPFGVKKDSQGTEIDFNRVYAELIKPALEAAGPLEHVVLREHGTSDHAPVLARFGV